MDQGHCCDITDDSAVRLLLCRVALVTLLACIGLASVYHTRPRPRLASKRRFRGSASVLLKSLVPAAPRRFTVVITACIRQIITQLASVTDSTLHHSRPPSDAGDIAIMAYKRPRAVFEERLQASESPYAFYGTPIPPLDADVRDDGSYVPVWQQEVRDERGRKRLHGAFTGGFSAG
jgi:hypothetical protein